MRATAARFGHYSPVNQYLELACCISRPFSFFAFDPGGTNVRVEIVYFVIHPSCTHYRSPSR